MDDAAVLDVKDTEGPVFIFHGKLTARIIRHEVNLTGGKVGNVRCLATAKAVGFLRLLPPQAKPRRKHPPVFERKVDLHGIRFR